MKKLLPIIIIALILETSCKTSYVNIQAFDPPQIKIPPGITGLAIANNTEVDNKENSITEPVDSSKIIEELYIKEASEKIIEVLANGLDSTKRFRKAVVVPFNQKPFSNSATDWYKVEELCLKNRVSGLFSIESMKSSIVIKTKEINDSQKSDSSLYLAKMTSNLVSKFRLYDPINKGYFEELPLYDSLIWQNSGMTTEEAIAGLPDKITAARETGIHSAKIYIEKMTPVYFDVKRKIYTSKNEKLKKAADYAKDNQWRLAAQSWIKLERESEDKQIASFSAYNLAVYQEVLGTVHGARTWANRSNKHLPKRSTLKYINVLNKRIMDLDLKK